MKNSNSGQTIEEQLADAQALYHSSLDGLPQSVYRIDREGHILFGNKSYLATVGLTLQACVGKTAYDFFPKNLADKYSADDRWVIDTGQVYDTVENYQQPTTERISYVRVIKTPLYNAQGDIIGLQGMFWEISEQVQTEETVQQQLVELETITQVSHISTTVLQTEKLLNAVIRLLRTKFDLYHVHVYLLQEHHTILHLVAGTGEIGQQLLQQGWAIPVDAPQSIVAMVARTGEVVQIDDVRHFEGWLPNVHLPDTQAEIAVPITYEGKVLGVLDVQQNKVAGFNKRYRHLLQSLANHLGSAITNARLYETLTQLNEDKDKFFSIMAHDLRAPFQPLLHAAETLAKSGHSLHPIRIREMSETLYLSAEKIFNLLEDLLQWSRLQQGRMDYEPIRLNLVHLIEYNFQFLTDLALNKQITLSHNLQETVFVQADEYMLETVIRNLLSNAIKFTSVGGGISIAVYPSAHDNQWVELAIKDTGVGMDAGQVAQIFKVGSSTQGTANEKGTGLGVLMCKDMVEMHGGQIWVESVIGEGTTFKFTVPLTEPLPTWATFNHATDSTEPAVEPEPEISFVLPCVADLEEGYALARRGSMRKIKAWAIALAEKEHTYKPFADHICALAQAFEGKAITDLLETKLGKAIN